MASMIIRALQTTTLIFGSVQDFQNNLLTAFPLDHLGRRTGLNSRPFALLIWTERVYCCKKTAVHVWEKCMVSTHLPETLKTGTMNRSLRLCTGQKVHGKLKNVRYAAGRSPRNRLCYKLFFSCSAKSIKACIPAEGARIIQCMDNCSLKIMASLMGQTL